LNQPRDIPLAALIDRTSPDAVKFAITDFSHETEFNLGKRKALEKCFDSNQIEEANLVLSDMCVCRDKEEMMELISTCDICLSVGREFFVFKPIERVKYVALSMERCYFHRLIQVLPAYKGNLKIFLHSEAWLEEDICGLYEMGPFNYGYLDLYSNSFEAVDILGHYKSILSQHKKDEIKEEFGVPKDKKVVLFSFRRADKQLTVHGSESEYYESCKENLKKLKELGYYVICRRRLSEYDIARRKDSAEVKKYDEFSDLIDKELSGFGHFPEVIWKAMHISNMLYLSDVSSIADIEAAICRTPVFLPREGSLVEEKLKFMSPRYKDLFERGLIFDSIEGWSESEYKKGVEDFIQEWYNTDVNEFWKRVYE